MLLSGVVGFSYCLAMLSQVLSCAVCAVSAQARPYWGAKVPH